MEKDPSKMNINDINKLAGLYFPGEDNNSLEKL